MNLLRSTLTVGILTSVSRILGFFRDVLIAGTLGPGFLGDIFLAAFRIPNLFRSMLAEGAFTAAFVPLFSGKIEHNNKSGARTFVSEIVSFLTWGLIALTAILELAMPLVIHTITPGFTDNPDKFNLLVFYSRITFFYLTPICMVALMAGILNTLGRFTAAASAPIILNIVLILTLFSVDFYGLTGTKSAVLWLSIGVTVAGFLQLTMVWIAVRRTNFTPKLTRPKLTPDVKKLIKIGIPGFFAAGALQINTLTGTAIASFQEGAISFLYFAERIYQLPLGVIGIAIGVVLLPDLSRRLKGNDQAGAVSSQNRACELSMLLTLPAATALIIIPTAIISVLFEHGHFNADDTAATAPALAAFAVGLPAFVLVKIFQPGFFAREDTKTPMTFAIIGVCVNIAGSLALFPIFGHIGIAVATSFSSWVIALLLIITSVQRGNYTADAKLLRRLPAIVISSAVMAMILWTLVEAMGSNLDAIQPLIIRIAALGTVIAGGVTTLVICLKITGGAHLREFSSSFRKNSGTR
jgi:putative peptidoglycan lipid II flippase